MALSTTRTLLTQTGINTHQVLNVGGLDSAGIATFSNFKTGLSNLHSTGLTVGDTFLHSTGVNLGAGATVSNNGNATFSGIITASSFVGDISNATGAAAGLGTALSQTQTDPLNKIYYTDKVLSISTTQTIDHPATANLAYTQYGDIKIEDGHDLIIKDGDDFKYDILGISTTKLADNYFPNGLSGDLTGDVTGNLTGNVTGNLTGDVTGDIVVRTAGKGVDFSVQTPTAVSGATATGEVLSHYEEGTWTPFFINVNTPTFNSTPTGRYTRIGRFVYLTGVLDVASGLDTSDGSAVGIGGLPFVGNTDHNSCIFSFGRYTSLMSNSRLAEVTNFRFNGNSVMLHRGNNYDINYTLMNSSGKLEFAMSYSL